MRHGARTSFLERQTRLGAVQCLDLAFLVATQDERMLRAVEIEPHHILEFLHEAWIIGNLEGARQGWLEAMRLPDFADRGRANVQGFRQRAPAPMRAQRGT